MMTATMNMIVKTMMKVMIDDDEEEEDGRDEEEDEKAEKEEKGEEDEKGEEKEEEQEEGEVVTARLFYLEGMKEWSLATGAIIMTFRSLNN